MKALPAEGNPEVTVLEVGGIVDSLNVTDFFQFVNKLFKGGVQQITIDLSQTSYLSSGALSVIVDAFKKAEGLGGKVVICGVPETVRELFAVVQFDRIFEFYPDVETAVASFQPVP